MSFRAFFLPFARKRSFEILSLTQNLGRQFDQGFDLDMFCPLRLGPEGWRELQCAHAPLAGVTESFHRIETLRRPTLRGQPGVDQRVTETCPAGNQRADRAGRETSWAAIRKKHGRAH